MTATGLLLAASMMAAMPQQADPPRFSEARFTPAPLKIDDTPPAPVTATAPAGLESEPTAASEREPLTWRSFLHRVGGALVGGWVGYVGAQVAKSDWDKKSNGSLSEQRSTWAAAGAVLGVFGSRLIGNTRAPNATVIRPERPKSGPFYLAEAEIRDSGARDAHELIYNTRMHWLVTRGANSVAEIARGEAEGDFVINVTPGRDKIIVYMDDVRLGGVDTLRDVPVDGLTSARFFDAREATLRYGTGHAHGAILLSTSVDG